jgi:hypothetical protein
MPPGHAVYPHRKDGGHKQEGRGQVPQFLFFEIWRHAMRKLICRCPETEQPVDLELYTDYATLARIWSNSLRFQCPHCGAEHETNVGAAWLEDTLGGVSTTRVR